MMGNTVAITSGRPTVAGLTPREEHRLNDGLDHLTEADIHARCTEASFERGWSYYTGGAVRQRIRLDDSIETRVASTHAYRVTVREAPGQLVAFCTCPYDWGGDCKHIVAILLAWLHEPDSFCAPADLQAALAARSKEELSWPKSSPRWSRRATSVWTRHGPDGDRDAPRSPSCP